MLLVTHLQQIADHVSRVSLNDVKSVKLNHQTRHLLINEFYFIFFIVCLTPGPR